MQKPISALVILAVSSQALGADDLGRDTPIQLFLRVCAATYAHPREVANVAAEFGFTEVANLEASPYLKGEPGIAWQGRVNGEAYALTLQENGVCTVIVYSGDMARLQSGLESWLPPVESGIAIKKETSATPPGIRSTTYDLSGGKVHERWVITVSTNQESLARALLSWKQL